MKINKYLSHLIKASLICIICVFLFSCKKDIPLKGDIEGTVNATSTSGGLPIEGALVELRNTDDSTRTDSLGSYKLTGITPGDYEIKASKYPSYNEETRDVEVLSGQTINEYFVLEGVPFLYPSSEYLDFDFDLTTLKFGISNIGLGELTYDVYISHDWITVDPVEGTLTDETDSLTVTIDNIVTGDSTYFGTIVISVVNGDDVTIDVYVNRYVTDARDNVKYKIVKIGDQWWMAENIKSTKYADGTPLVDGSGAGDITGDFTTKYYFAYDDNNNNVSTYGRLYTWAAAMNGAPSSNLNPSGVQGICPDGWYVPSDTAWKELELFLGMDTLQVNWVGALFPRGNNNEGGKLKEIGTMHWAYPNEGATNETGFTALPGGYRHSSDGYARIYLSSHFWSSTWSTESDLFFNVYSRLLYNGMGKVARGVPTVDNGLSVRCVRDPGK